jgi:N,N'-diacetyllegionaminate synthase
MNFKDKLSLNSSYVFITFEIGPTHTGFESCINYCDKAHKSGADAIKIQMIDAERLISDKKQIFEYKILSKNKKNILNKKEALFNILKRRELKKNEIEKIKIFCDKKNIEFFATVLFKDDIDFLREIKCKSIKIASADINYYDLLIHAAKSKMNIQIDTGMSNISEIYNAVKIIKSYGNNNIIIHQCPTGYPAKLTSIDLRMITTLRNKFKYPVAFSDHSPGHEMDVAAVALGAKLIEKTITFDRSYPSVEHLMSIELNQLKEFVKIIRNTSIALGRENRFLSRFEIRRRNMVRRSAFFVNSQAKGTRIKDCKFEFKRPGTGVTPDQIEDVKNKKLKFTVKKDQMLRFSSLKKS